jgi:aldose 1-epimerase
MNRLAYLFILSVIILSSSCKKQQEQPPAEPAAPAKVTTESFGTMPDGHAVTLYTVRNQQGMEMGVINYGGIIVSLTAPDKAGNYSDVVLGFDSLSQYIKSNPYFGALIGRYGNRIAKGKFKIDNVEYSLPVNNGVNSLHGGTQGFDKVFWDITVQPDSSSLKLTYRAADGEQGYPGNLQAEVIYTLTDQNELKVEYSATTDKKTVINLTQHTYFNLSGDANKDILEHQLMLQSEQYLPVDKGLIPTGELRNVAGTPFDFKTLTVVGSRINEKDEQLALGGGYDHCWILTGSDGTLRKIGELYEPTSGRLVEVSTTEPGIQFYTGNFLDGTLKGKEGVVYKYRSGLCLETQHYPDSPNQASFPSTLLNPGDTYKTKTVYKFTTR